MGSGLMSSPIILYSESNQNLSSSPSLGSIDGIHYKNNSGIGVGANSYNSIGNLAYSSGIILIESGEDLLSREILTVDVDELSITFEKNKEEVSIQSNTSDSLRTNECT